MQLDKPDPLLFGARSQGSERAELWVKEIMAAQEIWAFDKNHI